MNGRLHRQKLFISCREHVAEGAGTDGLTEEVDEDLPQTVKGNKMVDVQVNSQSLYARAVLDRMIDAFWGSSPVQTVTGGTLFPLQLVLRHPQTDIRQIENLAPLVGGSGSVVEAVPTGGTVFGCHMNPDLVDFSLGNLPKGVPLVAGLPARRAPGGATPTPGFDEAIS